MKRSLALSFIVAFLIIISSIRVIGFAASVEVDNEPDDIVIYNYKNSDNKIALTFDDGPHPRQTRAILDVLDEYGIKATFFAVGINVENYTAALRQVVERGHEIANHTYTHPKVSSLDYNSFKKQILDCEDKIYEKIQYKTKLLRPPEGMIDTAVRSVARELDYKVILWDIDTRDWAHTSPQKIADHVIGKVRSGDIILMHDYIGKNSPTVEALRLFIPKLLDMGYNFVVVSELISD